MKKNPKTRRPSKGSRGVAENTARRTQMTLELLQQLAVKIAANERAQRRFRTAIVCQVAKIETTVKMIHGAQIAEAHGGVRSDEMMKHAAGAEEFISEASDKLGLSMVSFIYDEKIETASSRGRKRKWSDWEI